MLPAFWMPSVSCRALTVEEIGSLVEAFGRAASFARGAGVDVVEIHGYGGYLLDQFMSSLWNRRTDGYGGDLDARMRFPLEVVEEIDPEEPDRVEKIRARLQIALRQYFFFTIGRRPVILPFIIEV